MAHDRGRATGDPRPGVATAAGEVGWAWKEWYATFTPPGGPGRGCDFVLALDDVKAGYGAPGAA
jgi:hypothetical protein